MAVISLREYHTLIDSLIDQNKYDEAVFHCNTILETYPNTIETLKFLGKSQLELNQQNEATDTFSRILSILPDDAIAHAGLCAVYEEMQDLDKAIHHMELAFDLQPSNLAIQEELKRLYQLRDSVAPSKIRLTRGALIRMYAKGDLYPQAISEAEAFLQDFPQRTDIKLLLAKMLFSQGSNDKAAELCTEILELYPDCLEANRIMDALTDSSTDDNLGETVHRQRLISLDPYYSFIDDEYPTTSDVPAETILVEKSEYIAPVNVESNEPEWTRQFAEKTGENLQEESSFSEERNIESLFDETTDEHVDDEVASVPFIEETALDTESQPASDDDLPDWISKAGWIRATENESEVNSLIESDSPIEGDRLDDLDQISASPVDELPDWLKPLNPEISQPTDTSVQISDEGIPEDVESSISNLADLSTEELEKLITGDEFVEEEVKIDTPVMNELSAEDLSASRLEEKTTDLGMDEDNELPDWLKDFDIELESKPDEELLTRWMPVESADQSSITQPEEAIIEPSLDDNIDEVSIDLQETLAQNDESVIEPPLSEDESYYDKVSGLVPPPLPLDEVLTPQTMPENDTEETEEETAVPSWVKRILGSIAPVADVPASETVKQDLEKSSEPVTPLITDLPEEIPHSGILSDDENIELMEWLKDTDLEIQESKGELIKETEEGVQPELTSFISESESELLPTLELESEEALDLEPASGLTKDVEMFDRSIEQVLDLDQEPASLAEIVVKQEEPAEVTNVLMDPLRLVDENNFADLENYLDENRLAADHSALLVEKINQKLSLAPDTFELWQSLGDVLVNNSKFMDALEAYKTAEKILLNK